LNLLSKAGFSPALAKRKGAKNGSKLGKLYSSIGLSNCVMAFLIASDKQLLKSNFLLSHFVNVEADGMTDLDEDFLHEKIFTQFETIRQAQDTQKC
jgi:hypothetical protein